MSTTNDRLHTAYFPSEYADILMDVLAITPTNLLNVKDALYHFRQLDDDQAADVIEHIADRIDTAEMTPTAIALRKCSSAVYDAVFKAVESRLAPMELAQLETIAANVRTAFERACASECLAETADKVGEA